MRLKNNNILYLILVPFLVVNVLLGAIIARGLLRVGVIVVGGWIIYKYMGKVAFTPRNKKTYEDGKVCDFYLPYKNDIRFYTSEQMTEYDFLNRNVEVVSNLFEDGFKLYLNPNFIKEHDKGYLQMLITREVSKYENKMQVKSILGLGIPLSIIITTVELLFVFEEQVSYVISGGMIHFIMPIIVAISTAIVLVWWNSNISKMDEILDSHLLKYFTKDQVREFIIKSETLQKSTMKDNSKMIQDRYIQSRLEKL